MEQQLANTASPVPGPQALALTEPESPRSAAGAAARFGWADYAALPCRVVVYLPLQQITLDELLRIVPGTIFRSSHHFTDFLSLRVNELFIANVSLEPAGATRGVRIHDFESHGNLTPPATVAHLAPAGDAPHPAPHSNVRNCTVPLSLCFGTTMLLLEDALQFASGQLLALDQRLLDPVSLLVDDRVVAYGTPSLHSDCYSIQVTEVVDPAVQ